MDATTVRPGQRAGHGTAVRTHAAQIMRTGLAAPAVTAPAAGWPATTGLIPAAGQSRAAGTCCGAVRGPAAPGIRGTRLGGRYRLDDLVDAVAGADLWRSVDEVLNRPVTAWVLAPGRPVPVEVIAAVLGAAGLADYRLARVFDADCEAGIPYIICEWPAGQCVDDLIASGLPDPWVAAAIVAAAAETLAAAHRAGYSHLCLSPRSLTCGAGGVKIAGVAIEAAVSGTTAVDPAASDTRGLARLLYALLTGYWTGPGRTVLPQAPADRGMSYRPRVLRPAVPAALDSVVCRVLYPRPWPGDHLRTPAGLAQELRAAIGQRRHRPAERPGGRGRRAARGTARADGTSDLPGGDLRTC